MHKAVLFKNGYRGKEMTIDHNNIDIKPMETETQKVVMMNEIKELPPPVRRTKSRPILKVQKSQASVEEIPEPDNVNVNDYKLQFD